MTQAFINSPTYQAWPFWVLELSPSSKSVDIHKAASTINAKLELGAAGADKFSSPEGPKTRDVFLVREAKAKLLDPTTRLLAEFWYIEPKPNSDDNKARLKKSTDEWAAILGVQF